jgi:hypothetical protein
MTNAEQTITTLEWLEVDGRLAPDCRRVLQSERFALLAAVRSDDDERIERCLAEAVRVARLWGVRL